MIRGIKKEHIPFVLEEDRSNPIEEQTVFWIRPKTGHDNNQTVARYAAATRENRKGIREVDVTKMDNADQGEFLNIVNKVENFLFPDDDEPTAIIDSDAKLLEVVRCLSADHLSEILEAANNISKLREGEKKS